MLTPLSTRRRRRPLRPSLPPPVRAPALDLAPSGFASLQKASATLSRASDEKELQSRLDFILDTQILFEAP